MTGCSLSLFFSAEAGDALKAVSYTHLDVYKRQVLLHAFQMLCPGCVSHAVPQAERVHQEYAEHGVSVIGLHTVFEHHAAMMPVALEAFLHEYRVTHPVGVDVAVAGISIPVSYTHLDVYKRQSLDRRVISHASNQMHSAVIAVHSRQMRMVCSVARGS